MACPRPVSRPAAGSERSPPRARPKRRGRGRFYRSWAASRFMVLAADRPAGLVDRPGIVSFAVRPRQRDADHAVPRHDFRELLLAPALGSRRAHREDHKAAFLIRVLDPHLDLWRQAATPSLKTRALKAGSVHAFATRREPPAGPICSAHSVNFR